MFKEAIEYPRNSDGALKTVAIGGVLLFVSFLVIPTVLVFGYIVRVLRDVMNGATEPPAFDEWGDLFVDGIKAFAVALAYSLVPAALFVGVALAGGVGLGVGGDAGAMVALAVLVGGLVAALVSLALLYVLPAALVAFVRADSLSAAFAPAELRPLAFSRTYATGWLVAVGISLLSGVVIGVLNALVVGAILAPFVTFYANVAGAYAIASAVRDAPAVDTEVDGVAGQPAA